MAKPYVHNADPFAIFTAEPDTALTVVATDRRRKTFPTQYAAFVRLGSPGFVWVRKLYCSGLWKARWGKPARIPLTDVIQVHRRKAKADTSGFVVH